MILAPIFKSLLENDQYKFNMGNVIFKRFNDYTTTWAFKCRNFDVKFTPEMIQEIREQFDHYCTLRFTDEELNWLKTNLPWLSVGYINYLKFWHPVREEVSINENNITSYNDCGLAIEARGTWLNTSMYEIPLLAIVNEVYFAFKYGVHAKDDIFKRKTIEKVNRIKRDLVIGPFSEFGMRRRLSASTQDWLIRYLVENKAPKFVGTSNVYLAKKYGVKAVGTQAHEYYMAFQSKFDLNPTYTNMYGMKVWVEEYQTRNGIALTDTIGTDVFLKDFNLTYANLFSGVRHDSGDPIEWGDKMLAHYQKLGIDPKTKTLLFSDSLDFEKAAYIYDTFEGKCNIAFGIGTYLANDTDAQPLNIVMKMVECNNSPVAKLSNTPGKVMCKDNEYIDYLNRCINWRLTHEK